jgi:hypothetical protein
MEAPRLDFFAQKWESTDRIRIRQPESINENSQP